MEKKRLNQQICPLEQECTFAGEEAECENGLYNECQYFAQTFDKKVYNPYIEKIRRKF